MCKRTAKIVLLLLAVVLVLGLLGLTWAIGQRSAAAQEGAIHNCPQTKKREPSVWEGDDGAEASRTQH